MDLNKKDIHIYFDMDGTVNHWDLNGNPHEEHYFRYREPFKNVLNAIKMLQKNNYNVSFATAAYIEEYQTDEDGKIKTDENGNKIKQNNDVKYITDANGQTIAIADTDDFADNLDSALNKYSNLFINTKTSSFADSNSLSFGEENSIFNGTIDINNRRYNIGKEFNENTDTVGSTIIINYIKCRNLYNENDVNNTILVTDSARSENLLLDNNVNDKYNGYTYIKRDTTESNNDEILLYKINENNNYELIFKKYGLFYINATINLKSNKGNISFNKTFSVYVCPSIN